MSKFSNLKINWPKSVEKLENGGRLGPSAKNLSPPKKKRSAGSASAARQSEQKLPGALACAAQPCRLKEAFCVAG